MKLTMKLDDLVLIDVEMNYPTEIGNAVGEVARVLTDITASFINMMEERGEFNSKLYLASLVDTIYDGVIEELKVYRSKGGRNSKKSYKTIVGTKEEVVAKAKDMGYIVTEDKDGKIKISSKDPDTKISVSAHYLNGDDSDAGFEGSDDAKKDSDNYKVGEIYKKDGKYYKK